MQNTSAGRYRFSIHRLSIEVKSVIAATECALCSASLVSFSSLWQRACGMQRSQHAHDDEAKDSETNGSKCLAHERFSFT